MPAVEVDEEVLAARLDRLDRRVLAPAKLELDVDAVGATCGTPLPELELMVKYGMTPLEAIRSATTIAADCLGLGAVTGRIAPGYAADLIAVAGDPAERLQALRGVGVVRIEDLDPPREVPGAAQRLHRHHVRLFGNDAFDRREDGVEGLRRSP